MRKTALIVGLLATAGIWAYAQGAAVTYKANLAGNAEVPPVNSQGRGTAQVNADTATNQASWRVEYTGLSGPATGAHIHCGAPAGGNAGVAVNFGTTLASPITGSGAMTPAQMQQLQGGEIRGQLAP